VNDESRFDSLTDDDLEQVTGGMSCSNAVIAANVYNALSGAYISLGMYSEGAAYAGEGQRILQGACT